MIPNCANDCVEPVRFPVRPTNRPGLSHIRYRIGTYSDFREAILRGLDKDPVLSEWTHRGADDPAVALIEGASILGDILTFYQELCANEAYLRTAQQRDSIADLVRLLGYRLAPGQGGAGDVAFGIKGDKPVDVPVGFGVKAQVGAAEKQLDFQTSAEATSYPHLSQFHLYRPRLPAQPIVAGPANNRLEVQDIDGAVSVGSIGALDLKKGDRIMLVPDAAMFDVPGTPYSAQKKTEILIVSKVDRVLDRTIITFEGSLVENRGASVKAYKLGRTFRHFGHNAPALLTKFDNASQKATQEATNFTRTIWTTHSGTANYYSTLLETEMPLDQSVSDLAVGGKLVVQGFMKFDAVSSPVPFTVVKDLTGVGASSLVWGNLSGPATMVTVNARLAANGSVLNEVADIRQLQFHEVKGPQMTLRAPSRWNSGAFVNTSVAYFGLFSDAVALAGRKLLLSRPDGTVVSAVVTSLPSDISLTGRDTVNPWLWPILLSEKPAPFTLDDLDEKDPVVTVYGNIVPVTQGKAERPATLGNGDNRQAFQTFKLPKAPLTYLNDPAVTPPEVPELDIYVNDRLWALIPSLFGRRPEEEVYIVREDVNNDSWVQFGDGKTGARLPSGIGNVTAQYRTGFGAFGPLKDGTSVQAAGKLERLDKVWLPGVISGGEDPEDGANARDAAPGKIQSLDRLVSASDFAAETLAIAGVSKAAAAWELVNNVPAMVVTVLMDTGRAAEIASVQTSLNSANRCRGPQRFPVIVHQGARRYLYISATFALASTYREEIVTAAIKAALGVAGEEGAGIDGSAGLLGMRQRAFGEKEYATRVAGAIQNVEGVAWAKVTALGPMVGSGDDPAALTFPAAPLPLLDVAPCDPDKILALHTAHLELSVTAVPSSNEC